MFQAPDVGLWIVLTVKAWGKVVSCPEVVVGLCLTRFGSRVGGAVGLKPGGPVGGLCGLKLKRGGCRPKPGGVPDVALKLCGWAV